MTCPPAPWPDTGRSIFVTAPDGLRLHVREYGTRTAPGLPVVCLPGLAAHRCRFRDLAPALAQRTAPRRVRRHRFSRARPIRLRPQSGELQSPGRTRRRRGRADRARRRPRRLHRQLAGRASHHAARRGASDRDRRHRAARHRPGDRAEGTCAHQELRRQAAAAAQF